jgi:hypothetical protein
MAGALGPPRWPPPATHGASPSTPTGGTTGGAPFPECQMHSGKTPKHSGKTFPSATLEEGLPGKRFTGKRPSPSVKSRALGETFPECHPPPRGRFNTVGAVSFFLLFPECNTRGRNFLFLILKPLPRVQDSRKKFIF